MFFNDDFKFYAVTYLKSGSTKERGIYLPNYDSEEYMLYIKEKMPDTFERTKSVIEDIVRFNDITFVIFSILHELGHWLQYYDYIKQGHNDESFIFEYEIKRADLFLKRKSEYQQCKSIDDVKLLNKKYDLLYSELPSEKFADEYALKHIKNVVAHMNLQGIEM